VAVLNEGEAAPAATTWHSQARLVLGVHLKVARRAATATPGRRLVTWTLVVLGSVASLLVGGSAVLTLAIAQRRFRATPDQVAEAVHLACGAVLLLVACTPVLGFRAGGAVDASRIAGLPLRRGSLFAASCGASFLSGGVLFFLPPLLGLAAGHSEGPGGFAVRALLAVLLLVHAVIAGQVLVLLFLDALRSPRWRDALLVAAPLVGGLASVATFAALTRRRRGSFQPEALREFLDARWSDLAPFLPSRWLSEAWAAAEGGPWTAWVPLLLGFLPATYALARAGAALQDRLVAGEIPPPPPSRGRETLPALAGSLLRGRVPDEALAVAGKERAHLAREPMVRSLLTGQAVVVVLGILALSVRSGEDAVLRFATWSAALPYMLVFVENTLVMNLLGLEGAGARHLLCMPVRWRTVLLGKDLCYLVLLGGVNAVASCAAIAVAAVLRPAAFPSPALSAASAVIGGFAALAVLLAVGNVVSVLLPSPLAGGGRGALAVQARMSDGVYEKFVRMLVFAGTAVLVAPVPFLLVILPSVAHGWFQEDWWPPVGMALSAAYAAALLRASLGVAEQAARGRGPLILDRLVRGYE
jgi:hypothetical protein